MGDCGDRRSAVGASQVFVVRAGPAVRAPLDRANASGGMDVAGPLARRGTVCRAADRVLRLDVARMGIDRWPPARGRAAILSDGVQEWLGRPVDRPPVGPAGIRAALLARAGMLGADMAAHVALPPPSASSVPPDGGLRGVVGRDFARR